MTLLLEWSKQYGDFILNKYQEERNKEARMNETTCDITFTSLCESNKIEEVEK